MFEGVIEVGVMSSRIVVEGIRCQVTGVALSGKLEEEACGCQPSILVPSGSASLLKRFRWG